MVAVAGLNTLIDFRYTQHFKAKRGSHGMGKNRTGASAPDLVIEVPVGTQVFDEERDELIADFVEVGQREVLLEGGMRFDLNLSDISEVWRRGSVISSWQGNRRHPA